MAVIENCLFSSYCRYSGPLLFDQSSKEKNRMNYFPSKTHNPHFYKFWLKFIKISDADKVSLVKITFVLPLVLKLQGCSLEKNENN